VAEEEEEEKEEEEEGRGGGGGGGGGGPGGRVGAPTKGRFVWGFVVIRFCWAAILCCGQSPQMKT
jgi:hypothetical protein